MKKILVVRDDNTVAIIIPSDIATDETMLRDALAVPGYISHRDIEDSEIPNDRTFRDAWIHVDGKLDYNLDKCRQIKAGFIMRQKISTDISPVIIPEDMANLNLEELKNYQPKEIKE